MGIGADFVGWSAILPSVARFDSRFPARMFMRLFDLLSLEDGAKAQLLGGDYSVPRGPLSLVRYLRATLLGDVQDLAAADQQYPICEWTSSLDTVVIQDNGKYGFTLKDNCKVKIGDKAQFRPEQDQIWDGGTLREVGGIESV
jgi:hypothetical protein